MSHQLFFPLPEFSVKLYGGLAHTVFIPGYFIFHIAIVMGFFLLAVLMDY